MNATELKFISISREEKFLALIFKIVKTQVFIAIGINI